MIDQDAALLLGNRLFGNLPAADRSHIVEKCTRKVFRAREVIFHQGDSGREMYMVLSGNLKGSVTSLEGRELGIFIFHQNDFFGELALLDGERRSATVTAITQCELLALHHQDFTQILQQHHAVGLQMMSFLASRIRETTQLYESSVFLEVPGRLAALLLELSAEHGSDTADGILIGLKLSQYELGTLVNASRESVNKQLKTWESRGMIQLVGGRICLARPDLLRELF